MDPTVDQREVDPSTRPKILNGEGKKVNPKIKFKTKNKKEFEIPGTKMKLRKNYG